MKQSLADTCMQRIDGTVDPPVASQQALALTMAGQHKDPEAADDHEEPELEDPVPESFEPGDSLNLTVAQPVATVKYHAEAQAEAAAQARVAAQAAAQALAAAQAATQAQATAQTAAQATLRAQAKAQAAAQAIVAGKVCLLQ